MRYLILLSLITMHINEGFCQTTDLIGVWETTLDDGETGLTLQGEEGHFIITHFRQDGIFVENQYDAEMSLIAISASSWHMEEGMLIIGAGYFYNRRDESSPDSYPVVSLQDREFDVWADNPWFNLFEGAFMSQDNGITFDNTANIFLKPGVFSRSHHTPVAPEEAIQHLLGNADDKLIGVWEGDMSQGEATVADISTESEGTVILEFRSDGYVVENYYTPDDELDAIGVFGWDLSGNWITIDIERGVEYLRITNGLLEEAVNIEGVGFAIEPLEGQGTTLRSFMALGDRLIFGGSQPIPPFARSNQRTTIPPGDLADDIATAAQWRSWGFIKRESAVFGQHTSPDYRDTRSKP